MAPRPISDVRDRRTGEVLEQGLAEERGLVAQPFRMALAALGFHISRDLVDIAGLDEDALAESYAGFLRPD